MKFDDFCRSNVLQVILKYHNEGSSRDVEFLTRNAYEEYTKSPHLRHIDGYYLKELKFFPPNFSEAEQRLVDQYKLPECYVAIGYDNWCMKTERYLLDKLKRTDKRENHVIANSSLFRSNLRILVFKYCRNKFREAREEREAKKRKALQSKSSRQGSISEYFAAKGTTPPKPTLRGPLSVQKKKLQMLRIFNTEDQAKFSTPSPSESLNTDCDLPEEVKSKPGPASMKRQLMKRYLEEVQTSQPKRPRTEEKEIGNDKEQEAEPVPAHDDDPPVDTELEEIKQEFLMRNLPFRPGPKSVLRARLERLKRKEGVIKAGPASKKKKQLMKMYKPPEEEIPQEEDQQEVNQENISQNTPPPVVAPVPVATSSKPDEPVEKEELTGIQKLIKNNERYRNAKKGTKLWLLLHGVFDPITKKFYAPDELPQAGQKTADESFSNETQNNSVDLPLPSPVKSPPSAKKDPPKSASPIDWVCQSQVTSLSNDDLLITNTLEMNARDVFLPRLFHQPEVLRKVKEILVNKAKQLLNPQTTEEEENLSVANKSTLDKSTANCSGMSQSQDSFVTVVHVNTPQRPPNPQIAQLATPGPPTTPSREPELILCDQLNTQSQIPMTQLAVDPFQSQQIVSPGKLLVDSEVEVSTCPDEVIEIQDDSCTLDEILRVSTSLSEKSEEKQNSPLQTPPPQKRKKKQEESSTPVQTPLTRSRIKQEQSPVTSTPSSAVKGQSEQSVPRRQQPLREVPANDKEITAASAPVAFRYCALPLQHKGKKTTPKIDTKKKTKTVKSKGKTKEKEEDIHTRVRFQQETEGTAFGLDIQDASMTEDEEVLKEVLPRKKGKEKKKEKKTLVNLLQDILENTPVSEDSSAQPFTHARISKLSHERDDKGNFYSDSCGKCALAAEFTVEGMWKLQLDMEMNRFLLNLTVDQWESFQRLLKKVDKFKYSSWAKERNGGVVDDEEDEINCCNVTRTLNLLLKMTPKLGVNVGGVKGASGIGAKSVFFRRLPERKRNLDLTECFDPRILNRLEDLVKGKEKTEDVV